MRLPTLPADFEKLARENMDALYTKALAITHNTPKAEQLVQITFSDAYQTFKTFNRNHSFRDWLFQILERHIAAII